MYIGSNSFWNYFNVFRYIKCKNLQNDYCTNLGYRIWWGLNSSPGWYSVAPYGVECKFIISLQNPSKVYKQIEKFSRKCFVLCNTCLGSDSERVFRKLWGEQAYFNSFSTSQRGLAILIKDCLPAKDVEIENVIKGNYTRCAFKVREQNVLLQLFMLLTKTWRTMRLIMKVTYF